MSDVVRSAVDTSQSAQQSKIEPSGDNKETHDKDTVEVPYLDYERENGQSLIADYFELGQSGEEFESELGTINSYLEDKVKSGKMDNNVDSVKTLIKQIEKMSNVSKTERTVVRVAKLAAYINFLRSTEDIDKMVDRYGNTT
jgi:hypothetical protein